MDCVICIGVFDGLHLGHQEIIGNTVRLAHEMDCRSVVITFSVNPKMAKGRMKSLMPVQSALQFTEMLANMEVDYHCVIDFSDDMSKLTGEEFIALLCTSYKVRAMVVGNSFRCGSPAGSAGPKELDGLLAKYTSSAFLVVKSSVLVNGVEDSSSLIRRCLLTGDLEQVSRLLGRAYSLDLRGSSPASGQNRLLYDVRTLGLLLPKAGQYKVEATARGQVCEGTALISEDHLALELPVRMIPDGITFLGEKHNGF